MLHLIFQLYGSLKFLSLLNLPFTCNVVIGNAKWTLFSGNRYTGSQVTLSPGDYPNPDFLPGGGDTVSSVKKG